MAKDSEYQANRELAGATGGGPQLNGDGSIEPDGALLNSVGQWRQLRQQREEMRFGGQVEKATTAPPAPPAPGGGRR